MALSGAVGSYQEFGYTGGMQSVTIPADGIYKLEVYGAKGGDAPGNSGGLGGYSIGYKQLAKGQIIYICVGQGGVNRGGETYNGGGSAGNTGSHDTGSGGGATHMASVSGTLKSIGASNISKIYLVAGGGGGAYRNNNHNHNVAGGSGGGLNGGGSYGTYSDASGGTQTSGYAFGYSSTECGGGGGGGLYGGNVTYYGAGGGSGYIGGVPSFSYNGTTYSPSTSNGQRYGNGYAKITFVALTKIYNLNVDGSAVQTVYLDGVALEQIKFDGVSVFGNP